MPRALAPAAVQYAVWKAYRPGQCVLRDGLRPSAAWFEAANTAIGYIADLEGQPLTASERDALERWRNAKPAGSVNVARHRVGRPHAARA